MGFAVWAMAVAVWIIGADEEIIEIGQGKAPAVASNSSDESIVAWEDDSQLLFQTLRMGLTLGTPIRVSSTDAAQQNASAAHLVEREFVVAWEEEGEDGTGIVARRVGIVDEPLGAPMPAMGLTLGTPIRITGVGRFPAVDADEDGDFVVAWTAPAGANAQGASYRHFAVRTSRMGLTLGTPIRLGGPSAATPPDVARRSDGDFLVVWEDAFADIRGAIVDDSGEVVRDRIRINQSRLGRQSSPAVTVPLDGNFTVVWERQVFNLRFVVGRRIGIDGEGIGGDFLVSLSASTIPTQPDVAADAWGHGFVTWTSKKFHFGAESILGRALDLDSAVGGESVLASPQAVVSSVDRSGGDEDFIVFWESETNPGSTIAGSLVLLP